MPPSITPLLSLGKTGSAPTDWLNPSPEFSEKVSVHKDSQLRSHFGEEVAEERGLTAATCRHRTSLAVISQRLERPIIQHLHPFLTFLLTKVG
ncbi:hypothetical protein VTL71DRAFT_10569, partial [Oculimacula yallundae]